MLSIENYLCIIKIGTALLLVLLPYQYSAKPYFSQKRMPKLLLTTEKEGDTDVL